ncbi:MAG: hypothetical protein II001_00800 [Bacteroidales bacterium]|nr:hypothetical protein [Bacteroidales bacterium]
MAQSSAGIRLFYCSGAEKSGSTWSLPTTPSWVEIPDITSIPAISGDPNMLDTTVLAETQQKTYIAGLKDNGGSMSYNAWLTTELIAAAEDAVSADVDAKEDSKRLAFAINFPSPLNCYYWYIGTPQAVLPGEAEVDAVIATTFVTSMETAPQMEEGNIEPDESE